MVSSPEPPALNRRVIVAELARHGVDYLLVGGVAANAYGALRPTIDFDCLSERSLDNLERLAAAMRELHARLRAEGVSDEDAKQLPVQLDGRMLSTMEISTWSTDAGPLDILSDIPARDGTRRRYEDLVTDASIAEIDGTIVRLAGLGDIIASKQWANRPKDHQALPELRRIAARLEADEGSGQP